MKFFTFIILAFAQLSFAQTNKVVLAQDLPIEEVSFRLEYGNYTRLGYNLANGQTGFLTKNAVISMWSISDISKKVELLSQQTIRLARKCDTVNIVLYNANKQIQFTHYSQLSVEPGSNCSK